MARPSNTTQRRMEIVQAMIKVISTRGYENASIQAIGQEAGLAPGLIHYHFKKKQDILVELIQSLAQIGQARYTLLCQGAESAEQRIIAYIDAALALGKGSDKNAVAAWVVIGAEAIRQPEVRCLYQTIMADNKKELMRILKAYKVENKSNLSNKSLENLATLIIAAIAGAFQLSATAADLFPNNYAAKTLKAMLLSTLQGKGLM